MNWLRSLDRWLRAPGPGQYGPGMLDFRPDWNGEIAEAWIAKMVRKLLRR